MTPVEPPPEAQSPGLLWSHCFGPQAGTEKAMPVATVAGPPTESLAQAWAPHQHPPTASSAWEGQVLVTPFYDGKESWGSERQNHLPQAPRLARGKPGIRQDPGLHAAFRPGLKIRREVTEPRLWARHHPASWGPGPTGNWWKQGPILLKPLLGDLEGVTLLL